MVNRGRGDDYDIDDIFLHEPFTIFESVTVTPPGQSTEENLVTFASFVVGLCSCYTLVSLNDEVEMLYEAVFLCIAFVFSNLAFHLDDGSLTSSGSWRKDVRDQGRYHGYMAVPIFLAAWLARACQARASIYDKESAAIRLWSCCVCNMYNARVIDKFGVGLGCLVSIGALSFHIVNTGILGEPITPGAMTFPIMELNEKTTPGAAVTGIISTFVTVFASIPLYRYVLRAFGTMFPGSFTEGEAMVVSMHLQCATDLAGRYVWWLWRS